MPGSTIPSSTVIDLSRLPAPEVVEQLDYEAILAALQAELSERWPEFDATLKSEPEIKVLQVAAWRELILRQQVDDACLAVMLPYAAGDDLDNLTALVGVRAHDHRRSGRGQP